MSADTVYDKKFYDRQSEKSRRSAAVMVKMIVDLLQPKSVLDLGCGLGTWCAEFKLAGVPVVHGLDGPWVDRSRLEIPAEDFFEFDFGKEPIPYRNPAPLDHYDLVVSFEFLEHVEHARSGALADFIAGFGDSAVLGVAIPGQGGTHHVNEQWPHYWANLFKPLGFQPYDFLRHSTWWLNEVDVWYVQNIVGYFRPQPPRNVVEFAEKAALEALSNPYPIVHPRMFREKIDGIRKQQLWLREFRLGNQPLPPIAKPNPDAG